MMKLSTFVFAGALAGGALTLGVCLPAHAESQAAPHHTVTVDGNKITTTPLAATIAECYPPTNSTVGLAAEGATTPSPHADDPAIQQLEPVGNCAGSATPPSVDPEENTETEESTEPDENAEGSTDGQGLDSEPEVDEDREHLPELIELALSQDSAGGIAITWNTPSIADVQQRFELYRAEATGPYSRIASGDIHDYLDADIEQGVSYRYFVIETRADGERQSRSAELSIMAQVIALPQGDQITAPAPVADPKQAAS